MRVHPKFRHEVVGGEVDGGGHMACSCGEWYRADGSPTRCSMAFLDAEGVIDKVIVEIEGLRMLAQFTRETASIVPEQQENDASWLCWMSARTQYLHHLIQMVKQDEGEEDPLP